MPVVLARSARPPGPAAEPAERRPIGQARLPYPTPCCARAQVNSIRRSLGVIAANSSAFGLRQPHLERTRLCELADSELDARYVRQRGDLQAALAALVKPKVIRGKVGAFALARGSAGARSLRALPAAAP